MGLFHANGAPKLGAKLNFQKDGGGGGGGGGKEGNDPPADDDDDADDDVKEGDDKAPKVVLTEKELNRRLALARKAAEKDTERKFSDAVAKAQKYDEEEESRKTEGQKAIDDAVKKAKADAEAEANARIATIQANADRRLIEAEFRIQAAALNFHDADDAWLRATPKLEGENAAIKLDEDGKIIGVKEYLEKLATDKPYLINAGEGNRVPAPPRGGGGNGPDFKEAAQQFVYGGSRRRR